MKKGFYSLEVAFVVREMESTLQIGFKLPENIADDFIFSPGQYLTLKVLINGKLYRRAYSICSPVHKNTISILVKRLSGGKVSNFLNDTIQPGDIISVLAPNGNFKISLNKNTEKQNYYLIGAGSGITPLMSMAQSILQESEQNTCHLLYGNRDEDSIIFKTKLERLLLVYPNRFSLNYVLSAPKKYKTKGWFSSPKQTWQGKTGRVNQTHIEAFLNNHPEKNTIGYYICGPGKMIEASVEALENLKIDPSLIHREFFTSADIQPVEKVEDEDIANILVSKAKIALNGNITELEINEKTNIVQALMNKGIEPPYSCLSGSCSTCKAKITEGKVTMDVSIGLEGGEEEEGYILTCQSRPITNSIAVTYDID